MLEVDQIIKTTTAINVRLVKADPDELVQLAERLRHQARCAQPGDAIICEFSPSVSVIWVPEQLDKAASARVNTP